MSNPFHHSHSGWYYSQNRWCEGASTLTKDNIKKDITIFGITGTYEGSVVWLIKNGELASGISVKDSLAVFPEEDSNWWQYNNVYNFSSSWRKVFDNKWYVQLSWLWQSRGDRRNDLVFVGVIGSKVSMTSDGKVAGVIGGDFRSSYSSATSLWCMSFYNGKSYHCNLTPNVPSGAWSGTFTSSGVTVGKVAALQTNDLAIGFGTYHAGVYLWAYNLWINPS